MWEHANAVVANPDLLKDLGFEAGCSIDDVVIAICVGDGVHPSKGTNYLGDDWRNMPPDDLHDATATRDKEAEAILQGVLEVLEKDGFDAAKSHAESVSNFQVVYLCRDLSQTFDVLESLIHQEMGRNELSDNRLEKKGEFLVIGYAENLSYFPIGDDILE